MVIPVEDSLIYAEPIYLQATQSKMPELKCVIFSYGDQVVMGDTLDAAINTLFNGNYAGKKDTPSDDQLEKTMASAKAFIDELGSSALVKKLVSEYTLLKNAAKNANWDMFGQTLRELGQTIEGLNNADQKQDSE